MPSKRQHPTDNPLDWQDFARRRRIAEVLRRSRRPSDLLARQEQQWMATEAARALADGHRQAMETRTAYYLCRLTRPPEG